MKKHLKTDMNAQTSTALVSVSKQAVAPLPMLVNNPNVPFSAYVMELPLDRIVPNPKNPRTEMADEGIKELAESIRRLSVESPILVIPLSDDRYQIVYGERRFRASQLAGKKTIPAKVESMTPEQAEIRAIHENIQRENMTPFDEGRAFTNLLKDRNMSVAEICATFAKSKAYVENRMNLTKLIPQIAELLRNKEITLEIAQVFAKYDTKVQKSTYEDHYKNVDAWCSWRGISAKELDKRLFETHLTKLNAYNFDKTECKTCASNTSNNVLFEECGDCSACRNPKCLQKKNTAYLIEHAVALASGDPHLNLAFLKGEAGKEVIDSLLQKGYEIKLLDVHIRSLKSPTAPNAPDLSRIEDEDDRNIRQKQYEKEVEKYTAECAKLDMAVISGRMKKYGMIRDKTIQICYEEIALETKTQKDGSTVAIPVSQQDEIMKQDKRNYEIRYENTVRDLKKVIPETIKNFNKKGALTDLEQQAFDFVLLSRVSSTSNMELLGMKGADYSEEKRFKFAGKITEKQKNLLTRMIISNYLENISNVKCTPDMPHVKLMLDFMCLHVPKAYAAIEEKYKQTYESRHKTLMKRAEELDKEKELLRLKELEQTLQKQGLAVDMQTGELKPLPAAPTPHLLTQAANATDAVEEAQVIATVEAPSLTPDTNMESTTSAPKQSLPSATVAAIEEPQTQGAEVEIPLTPAEVEPEFIELDEDEPLPDPAEVDPEFIEWEVENPFDLSHARLPEQTQDLPLAA